MSDLSSFLDEEFDLIVQPFSNLFAENISKVWKEASRVLKNKGVLISGFTNPLLFIFDDKEEMKGNLVVKNSIPSSSLDNLTDEEVEKYIQSNNTVEIGHTFFYYLYNLSNSPYISKSLSAFKFEVTKKTSHH